MLFKRWLGGIWMCSVVVFLRLMRWVCVWLFVMIGGNWDWKVWEENICLMNMDCLDL